MQYFIHFNNTAIEEVKEEAKEGDLCSKFTFHLQVLHGDEQNDRKRRSGDKMSGGGKYRRNTRELKESIEH